MTLLHLHPFPGRAKARSGTQERWVRTDEDHVPLRGASLRWVPDCLPLRFAPLQASGKGERVWGASSLPSGEGRGGVFAEAKVREATLRQTFKRRACEDGAGAPYPTLTLP
jgi:hypothetical protein